jgi:hypothetical protein
VFKNTPISNDCSKLGQRLEPSPPSLKTAARAIRPAAYKTVVLYRQLFEATLPLIGAEPIEDVLLLMSRDDLHALSWDKLRAVRAVDSELAMQLVTEAASDLRHLALVIHFPAGTEWTGREVPELCRGREVVAISVADKLGISLAIASIGRTDGHPSVERWAYAAQVTSDEPVVEFLDSVRRLIA